MTDPTVTERETRRADELKPGDWLAAGEALDDIPAEVLAALPYETATDGPSVTIVYRNSAGKPENWDIGQHALLSLATEAEIAAHRDVAKREHLAAELRNLADLIVKHQLPMPQYGMSITASFPSAAGVRQVAEALGLDVESRKPSSGVEVEWPKGRVSYEQGVHVTWLTIKDESAATPAQLAAVAAKLRADQDAEVACQGAPAGFEADCGIKGGHGPHGPVPEVPGLVHFALVAGDTACGLPAEGNTRRNQSLIWAPVTCQACLDAGGAGS